MWSVEHLAWGGGHGLWLYWAWGLFGIGGRLLGVGYGYDFTLPSPSPQPYLALTPATAGVGRCHKNFRQVSAGVGQFGRGTWKHTHTQVRQVLAGVTKSFGRCQQVS